MIHRTLYRGKSTGYVSAVAFVADEPQRDHHSVELSRSLIVEAVFQDIMRTLGTAFVPELFTGMRAMPAYLETAWGLFKEDLHLDQLDCKTKHIIALAITTDTTGQYYITAHPQSFRVHVLDEALCDKLVAAIRFFKVFERYLSGISSPHISDVPTFVRHCLRDEYWSFAGTRSSTIVSSEGDQRRFVMWIGRALIMSAFLWPIAVGVYLYLQ